jgi:hypothetical protein
MYSYFGSINKISDINIFLSKIGNNTKEEIDKLEKIIQVKNNQGVIFYAESGGIGGALHSEPKFDENRIFISILPGTKDNIEGLKKRWNR